MTDKPNHIVTNVIDDKCVVTVPQDVTEEDLQGLFATLEGNDQTAQTFIFDLSGVALMDETEFVAIQKHLKQHLVIGHKAAFCGVRPEMAAFLAFIDAIDGSIQWFSNLEAALNEI